MATKKRDWNFTQAEKMLLIDLVEEHVGIVESKKTDGVTMKEKEACWENISAIFNTKSTHFFRNAPSLKNCWDNLKKRTRKHFAELRRESFATGGVVTELKYDPVSERIRGIIRPSRLIYPYDGDPIDPIGIIPQSYNSGIKTRDMVSTLEVLDEEAGESSWASWSPAMLQTQMSLELTPAEDNNSSENEDRVTETSSTVRKRKRTASSASTATKRNNCFAALAESKIELIEIMKKDFQAKSEIEIEILKTQLEIAKKELKIKEAILDGKLPTSVSQ